MGKVFLNKNPLNIIMLNTAYLNGGYKKKLSDVDENGYIRFKDPEVLRVLLANNVGDGVGITKDEAENITSIGTWFKGNTEITSFNELSSFENVIEVVFYAFYECTSLESIDLTNIEMISNFAFTGCTSLKMDLNLPNVSANIGQSSFNGTDITSVIAPKVRGISASAFNDCKSLKRAKFALVEEFRDASFMNSTSLEEVVCPNLKILGNNVFNGCSSLSRIDLENVTTIKAATFEYCTSLSIDINLPKATSVASAFANSGIISFNAPLLEIIESYSYNQCSSLSIVNIPKVKTIKSRAFYECKKLVTVESDSLEVIEGQYSFTLCEKLKNINLSKVKSIDFYSFRSCISLDKVALPACETIGGAAFYLCSMLSLVDIGDKITSIGSNALTAISKTAVIIVRAITPPDIYQYSFDNTTIFYVPDDSVEAYKTATNWSNHASRIKPLSEYLE